jgi:hypothetical protein
LKRNAAADRLAAQVVVNYFIGDPQAAEPNEKSGACD